MGSRRTGPFVCELCRKIVDNPKDRWFFETNYVREDHMQRMHNKHVTPLCRHCIHEHHNPGDQQASFFPNDGVD